MESLPVIARIGHKKPPGCGVNGIAPVLLLAADCRRGWRGCELMAGTDLARDKKKPSQFLLCCFSSMAKTSNSIRPFAAGAADRNGP